MKIYPPGSEPYVILNRLDGYIGHDIPHSVAEHICARWPALGPRTEVERIKARMLARQHIITERRWCPLCVGSGSGFSRDKFAVPFKPEQMTIKTWSQMLLANGQ